MLRRGSLRGERRAWLVFADVLDDDVARRIDPAAVVGDVSKDANSFNDGVRGGRDVLGLLENVIERETEIVAAALKEPTGVGMAINGALGELVKGGDGARAAPLQEFLFDLVALRVLANGALALVS